MKSKEDPTNLLYKNISASYDAFSTQVEANKGYDILNGEKDIDEYERNKTYGDRDPKCTERVLGIFCVKYGWKPHKASAQCNP
jgi:hypothetical protein